MKNKEKALLGITCFLGGVVAGFLIAPINKGIYCGNNCGNHVSNTEDLKKIAGNDLEKYVNEINN